MKLSELGYTRGYSDGRAKKLCTVQGVPTTEYHERYQEGHHAGMVDALMADGIDYAFDYYDLPPWAFYAARSHHHGEDWYKQNDERWIFVDDQGNYAGRFIIDFVNGMWRLSVKRGIDRPRTIRAFSSQYSAHRYMQHHCWDTVGQPA